MHLFCYVLTKCLPDLGKCYVLTKCLPDLGEGASMVTDTCYDFCTPDEKVSRQYDFIFSFYAYLFLSRLLYFESRDFT